MTGYDVAVVGLGALGSATAWQLARRGVRVLGLERFEPGHAHGASHDTSRILRRSYHTPAYVDLADRAYADWADLSAAAGTDLVTVTGGLDLFPAGAAIEPQPYLDSLSTVGVPFEWLDATQVRARWPAFRLPRGCGALYQCGSGIVPAARGSAAMRSLAEHAGADLRPHAEVVEVVPGTGVVLADGTRHRADRVVLTCDAWVNDLLDPLGAGLPLTVTQEQFTYFSPGRPGDFAPDRFPVWIWMDDPSFYGFPCYGEPADDAAVKAAQDCGGPPVTARSRGYEPDPERLDVLVRFLGTLLPGVGPAVRTKTCLYTLTPDRDLVLGALPGHDSVLVGLGAGHGFKFAPTIGRILADVATGATSTVDLAPYALDRPALRAPTGEVSWLV